MQNQAIENLKSSKEDLLQIWSQILANNGSVDGITEEGESEEFTTLFLEALNDNSISDPTSFDFDKVNDLLVGISSSLINIVNKPELVFSSIIPAGK